METNENREINTEIGKSTRLILFTSRKKINVCNFISELRERLCRGEKTFNKNLHFGVKVWSLIEFVLLTKTEIILDELCNNLPKLWDDVSGRVKCVVKNQRVSQFALCGRHGVVSVKEKLFNALSTEAEANWNRKNPSLAVLHALLTTL